MLYKGFKLLHSNKHGCIIMLNGVPKGIGTTVQCKKYIDYTIRYNINLNESYNYRTFYDGNSK